VWEKPRLIRNITEEYCEELMDFRPMKENNQ